MSTTQLIVAVVSAGLGGGVAGPVIASWFNFRLTRESAAITAAEAAVNLMARSAENLGVENQLLRERVTALEAAISALRTRPCPDCPFTSGLPGGRSPGPETDIHLTTRSYTGQ